MVLQELTPSQASSPFHLLHLNQNGSMNLKGIKKGAENRNFAAVKWRSLSINANHASNSEMFQKDFSPKSSKISACLQK